MAITFEIVSARLIRSQLEAGIDQPERDANHGHYNTLCIRNLGCAAKVLDQQEVWERAIRLLHLAPEGAFREGMITNIELPTTPPEWMRTIGSSEEWKDHLPLYQEEETVERIKSFAANEEHLALCLEGRFKEARAKVGSGRELEEVALILQLHLKTGSKNIEFEM